MVEGYPIFYTKVDVAVEDEQGEVHKAFAYVMTTKGCKEPSDDYYQVIGDSYRDWRLPINPLREAPERSHKRV